MVVEVFGPGAVGGKRVRRAEDEERVLGASDGDVESLLVSYEADVPVGVGADSADDDHVPLLPLEGVDRADAQVVPLVHQRLVGHALDQLHLALVRSDDSDRQFLIVK